MTCVSGALGQKLGYDKVVLALHLIYNQRYKQIQFIMDSKAYEFLNINCVRNSKFK